MVPEAGPRSADTARSVDTTRMPTATPPLDAPDLAALVAARLARYSATREPLVVDALPAGLAWKER